MKTNHLLITLGLFAALLFASCAPRARVGPLQTESQSVELGDVQAVRVEVSLGAGDLKVNAGAENLLEADFTYNVDRLKPEVKYTDGTLVIRQPDDEGLPDFRGIPDYRNEWGLRLNDEVPMDLSVNMGAGTSELQLAGLSLTGLDITLGAGETMLDLSGDWARDLNITIDTGAAAVTVRLPKDVGIRVKVDRGPTAIDAPGLTQDGDVYSNTAYGVSEVTLLISIDAGLGLIRLEVEE